jgi:hypothetical protein
MKRDVPVSSKNADAAPGILDDIDGQQILVPSAIQDAMPHHRHVDVTWSMDLAPERRRRNNTEELRKRRDEQRKAWNDERDRSRQIRTVGEKQRESHAATENKDAESAELLNARERSPRPAWCRKWLADLYASWRVDAWDAIPFLRCTSFRTLQATKSFWWWVRSADGSDDGAANCGQAFKRPYSLTTGLTTDNKSRAEIRC